MFASVLFITVKEVKLVSIIVTVITKIIEVVQKDYLSINIDHNDH